MKAAVLAGSGFAEATITAQVSGDGVGCSLRIICEAAKEHSIRESQVRVNAALAGLGVSAQGLLTVDLPRGASLIDLDLALALAALRELGEVALPEGLCARAELGLDGHLRPLRGTYAALESGPLFSLVLVARENLREAEAASSATCGAVRTLREAVDLLKPRPLAPPTIENTQSAWLPSPELQAAADRVRAAAEERRTIAILGKPGRPRLVLARYYASFITPTAAEAFEVARIYSIAGLWNPDGPLAVPFRCPHHSVSEAGMVGGGDSPWPGEVSLAHGGVLALDSFTEFRAAVLESTLHAVKQGRVTIARGGFGVSFPSKPSVVLIGDPESLYVSERSKEHARSIIEKWGAEVIEV